MGCGLVFLATALPAFSAPKDSYPMYKQAKVIGHLPLSGVAPSKMSLQQQGKKEYLYIQQAGAQGVTVVNVSKAKHPKVVTRVLQVNIASPGSGWTITQKPLHSRSWLNIEGPRGAREVQILDVSNPAQPKDVRTFQDVTSIVSDDARGLVFLANAQGIWIVSRQKYPRSHMCSSSDAISSAEPNCD